MASSYNKRGICYKMFNVNDAKQYKINSSLQLEHYQERKCNYCNRKGEVNLYYCYKPFKPERTLPKRVWCRCDYHKPDPSHYTKLSLQDIFLLQII